MKRCASLLLVILMILTLAVWRGVAGAAEETSLIFCEYSVYGGMANESLTLTLTRGEGWDILHFRRESGDADFLNVDATVETSRWAISDLGSLIARYAPETWADLPDAEYMALDAPARTLRVVYADGAEYRISDEKDLPGGVGRLFWEVRNFLESYTVADAQTFTLSLSSFDGGGPEYSLSLDAPERVDWYRQNLNDDPEEPQPPGAGYTVNYVFRGRIPGTVQATVHVFSPLAGNDAESTHWDEVFLLSVDQDYSVTLLPAEAE